MKPRARPVATPRLRRSATGKGHRPGPERANVWLSLAAVGRRAQVWLAMLAFACVLGVCCRRVPELPRSGVAAVQSGMDVLCRCVEEEGRCGRHRGEGGQEVIRGSWVSVQELAHSLLPATNPKVRNKPIVACLRVPVDAVCRHVAVSMRLVDARHKSHTASWQRSVQSRFARRVTRIYSVPSAARSGWLLAGCWLAGHPSPRAKARSPRQSPESGGCSERRNKATRPGLQQQYRGRNPPQRLLCAGRVPFSAIAHGQQHRHGHRR